jgi:subtilisin family serine protease
MGADIINNSWGGGGFSTSLKSAIDASDAVVVCAAGNSARNNDGTPHYPSSYSSANIIAVAASFTAPLRGARLSGRTISTMAILTAGLPAVTTTAGM